MAVDSEALTRLSRPQHHALAWAAKIADGRSGAGPQPLPRVLTRLQDAGLLSFTALRVSRLTIVRDVTVTPAGRALLRTLERP